MDWGEVNPTHAYYNGFCTSKDTEDPSWSTSFKTRRTQKTSSAFEALWKTLFVLYLYLIRTFFGSSLSLYLGSGLFNQFASDLMLSQRFGESASGLLLRGGLFTLPEDGESLESYYSRFYKMMNELVRNQCDVTNHQVNVQFLLQLQPEWQRFVTLVKQSQEMKIVSYHKLYDILKQHQNEVNKIRAERLAPATRNRGKAIVNSPPPTYDQEPEVVVKDDALSKEKEIDKLRALISLSFKKIYKPTNINLKTSSNTSRAHQDNTPRINRGTGYDNQRVVNVAGARENVGTQVVHQSGIQCYNCKEYGHVVRECQKPKQPKDAAYHKEKMLLCKKEEVGFQLNAKQADWRDDTDDEPDDQEFEAHYIYMAKVHEVTPDDTDNSGPIFDTEPLQKVQNDNDNYNVFANDREHPEQPEYVNDTYPKEQRDTNITIDSLDMSTSEEMVDQDDDDLARERDLLASLIDKLKCEIDEGKNCNKLLESSNKTLVNKCEIEDFKIKNKSLESSNNHFKEANNELSKTNQLMFKDLKKFQAELDRYHDVNYASKVEIDCAKAKGDLMSYKMESQKSLNEHTRKINELNQTISEMKKKLLAHQETISIMSQEKKAHNKFYKTREDKEIEKVIALENKVKDLDDIFLKKAQRANPRLYDIGCYNDNLALMLVPESDETIRLAEESRSKLKEMIADLRYFNSLKNEGDSLKSQLETQKIQFLNEIDQLSWEYYYADHMNAILGVYTTLDEFTNLQCDYLDQVVKCERLEKSFQKVIQRQRVLKHFNNMLSILNLLYSNVKNR
ncbi:retrovirus-related pol polyprotein from transposon TNT 1-94 [Tanacetum coccineum]